MQDQSNNLKSQRDVSISEAFGVAKAVMEELQRLRDPMAIITQSVAHTGCYLCNVAEAGGSALENSLERHTDKLDFIVDNATKEQIKRLVLLELYYIASLWTPRA